MKKRAAALTLCLALCLALAPVTAEAAGSVYITAAGNDILPLNDATMPFLSDGYLYVASSIFTGQVNKSLGVAYLPSNVSNPNLCILYAVNNRSLMFDLNGNFVRDSDGNVTSRGAIRRGGEIFVPASIVAEFFKLEYSMTPLSVSAANEASYGALVWFRQPNFGLSEKEFINAAFSQIAMRYEQYLREQAPEDSGAEENPGGIYLPEGDGKSVYLCLKAGDSTAAQLDVLDALNAQAVFFCSLEFLENQGDLLRRMTATGHAVGLLADAGNAGQTVEEQLETGNRLLSQATMGKTRLVKLQNGDERDRQAVQEAGFSCLEAELDWSDSGLSDSVQAENLLRQVSSRRGDVRIWLGGAAGAAGLRAFLTAAAQAEDRCLALTETP
nr:polysaccharide deacetylase family protein [uncultured Oscillibacter sp.]